MYKIIKNNILLTLFVTLLILQNANGYEYNGRRFYNNNMPTYYVNSVGTPDCSNEFQAIQAALNTWNAVTTTYANFQYGGTTTNSSVASNDGTNLIIWIESDWETYYPGSNAIGINSQFYYTSSGQIVETDISFNGEDYLWSDNGASGRMDVQNIATHELGHSISLADLYGSGDTEKTMYGYASQGETKKRTLHSDDIDGIRYVLFESQTSGYLSESQVWVVHLDGNTVSLTGNLYATSGKTLEVRSGTTINFNNYYTKVSGTVTTNTITVEQGVTENFAKLKLWDDDEYIIGLFPKIQQAADHAPGNTTSTIELFSKTYSGNVSITKDFITLKTNNPSQGNATINGNITITNRDFIVLDHLTMDMWKTISMSGGWANYVRFCKIKDSYTGANKINMYNCNNSSVYETNCTFNYSNTHAVYLYNTSSSSLTGNILSGNVIAVQASNNSFANAYNNNFCTNYGLDINALSGCTINAYGNYWTRPYPSSIGGNVSGGSHHTCSTQMNKENGVVESTNEEPISKEIIEIDKDHLELLGRIEEENEEKISVVMDNYKFDFDGLIVRYKALLNEKSDGVETTAILSKIEKCYYATEDEDEFETYIKNLLADKGFANVYSYIERYYVNLHLNREEYKEAIGVCEKVLSSKGINEALISEMLYEQGLIYKYSLDDTETALELFTTIVEKYPKNNLSSFAIRELEMEGKEIPKGKDEKGKITDNNLNKYVIENYPNPFNPSTTLSYSLPSASNVKLEIYDVMGRMIKSFSTNSQSSGTHKVVWDGTNSNGSRVATGIYIYRFEATSLETNEHFVESEKLMLVK